jgi:hypothetical protein
MFLEYKETRINPKNHFVASAFVQQHWNQFATFVDQKIRSGDLKGHAVKLNSYYDELEERREQIKQEYAELPFELSKDELRIIRLERHELSPIHSLIGKAGLKTPKSDVNFVSKRLQRGIPLILLLRENNLIDQAIKILKP